MKEKYQQNCPQLKLESNMVVLTPLDAIKAHEFVIYGPKVDDKFAEIVHIIHLTYTQELSVFSWSSGKDLLEEDTSYLS